MGDFKILDIDVNMPVEYIMYGNRFYSVTEALDKYCVKKIFVRFSPSNILCGIDISGFHANMDKYNEICLPRTVKARHFDDRLLEKIKAICLSVYNCNSSIWIDYIAYDILHNKIKVVDDKDFRYYNEGRTKYAESIGREKFLQTYEMRFNNKIDRQEKVSLRRIVFGTDFWSRKELYMRMWRVLRRLKKRVRL